MGVFDLYAAKAPRKPDRVQLTLTVTQADDGTRAYEGAITYSIMSADADPTLRVELERRQADLVPLLTTEQQLDLKSLLDAGIDAARGVVP